MWSILRTIWAVFLHAFHKRVTIQYPEQKAPLSPRYRGRIILSRDPDGGERPIGPVVRTEAPLLVLEAPLDDGAGLGDAGAVEKEFPWLD